MHYEYCVINNYKLLTTFQSVMLNSNEPIKVADTQKLVNQHYATNINTYESKKTLVVR